MYDGLMYPPIYFCGLFKQLEFKMTTKKDTLNIKDFLKQMGMVEATANIFIVPQSLKKGKVRQ